MSAMTNMTTDRAEEPERQLTINHRKLRIE